MQDISKTYEIKNYKEKSIIYLENTKAQSHFYIVQEGELKGTVYLRKKCINFTYKKGDTFGLIACMTEHDYFERVTTISSCSLIIVKKDGIVPFLLNKKEIFIKIISNYSDRLRELDKILIKQTGNCYCIKNPGRLLEIAAFFENNGNMTNMIYALKKYVQLSDNKMKKDEIKKKLGLIEKDYKTPEVLDSKISLKAGDIVFLEQEKGNVFYYIEKGKVKITHIHKDEEIIIAILGNKEFFGEMALLNRVSRNASAITFEDTELTVLNRDNFMDKLSDVVLKNIFLSFAKRIWFTYRKILNQSYKNPLTKMYDYLELLITSREGRVNNDKIFFDFSIKDLKKMTNTTNVKDEDLYDILNDPNISFNYGLIAIMNKKGFLSNVEMYKARENLYKS